MMKMTVNFSFPKMMKMTVLFQAFVICTIIGLCLSRHAPITKRAKREVTALSAVSTDDIKIILDEHNNFRKDVSPTASNMRNMHWNEDLANVAQQWVDQCIEGHDNSTQRRIDVDLGVQVGQNYYWTLSTTDDWKQIIGAWHAEVDNFQYGTGASPEGSTITHYTQVVWGETSLVGCGFYECPSNNRRTFACNYARGNIGLSEPYKQGTPCADCDGHCVDEKLCDCPDGMICKNGGILHGNNCTCTCQNGFSGTFCEICPAVDQSSGCGTYYTWDKCLEWANVPDACPVMCGYCPDACANEGLTINSCQNGGNLVIEDSGCSCECLPDYSGDTCQTRDNCEDSTYFCQSVNPNANYGVETCTDSWLGAWLRTKCPTMCGVEGC